jgi:hypothetical protein
LLNQSVNDIVIDIRKEKRMPIIISSYPRPIHPAPDPLGFYIRVSRSDHANVTGYMAVGRAGFHGVVFNPAHSKFQQELKELVLAQRGDAILDPQTQPLATVGGYTTLLGTLPWGLERVNTVADYQDTSGRRLVSAIGDYALEQGYTQVMAPTHFIRSANDEWLEIDLNSTRRLQNHLAKKSTIKIPVIYQLSLPYALLRSPEACALIVERMHGLQADALWVNVAGFGAGSTATGVRAYLAAMEEFQQLGIPIVADHVGGLIGLSLLAFGGVGGVALGIAKGEGFNAAHWFRPKSGTPFSPHEQVYIKELDFMLKPAAASDLFDASHKAKARYVCRDSKCCPRGAADMLKKPGLHYLYQKVNEIAELSQIPEQLRPAHFVEKHLRFVTDQLHIASNMEWADEKLAGQLTKRCKRLDLLHESLGQLIESKAIQHFAFLPQTRAMRESHIQPPAR